MHANLAASLRASARTEIERIERSLLEVTEQYLILVNRIGAFQEKITDQNRTEFARVAEPLLAPNLRKILNGQLYTETRDAFIADLTQVNQTTSRWTVEPVDTITSVKTREVVLRLMIDMEKAGRFTAMVILRFTEAHQIFEINEVLSKMQDSYHFDG
jgi:hypothetical protein